MRGTRVVAVGAGLALAGAAVTTVNRATLPRLSAAVGRLCLEKVAVCVPARNEAHQLPLLLHDLAAQQDVPQMRVFVLDDDSTDGTAEVARAAVGGDPRFHLERGTAPPPPGWLGKQAACARLAELAAAEGPAVIVFLDADVRLSPLAVAAAVAELRTRGVALLSPWPTQVAHSAAERLVQPLLAWSWMVSVPVGLANRSLHPSLAVACGQFLACDAATYYRLGGHHAVASSLTEDLDIARHFRRCGAHTAVVGAGPLARCRMYTDLPALRSGYRRWLGQAFGPAPAAAVVGGGLALAYLVPPVALLAARGRARWWGAVGYTAAAISRWNASAAESGPAPAERLVNAAAHPVSVLAAMVLFAESRRHRRRRTVQWKGRPVG